MRGSSMVSNVILPILGLVLSLYAIYVKYKLNSPSYRPWCDINNHISCSKAFKSGYGSIAGIPNPYVGVIFYLFILIMPEYAFFPAAIAITFSLYLAYISYVKQKNFCVVCTA